MTTTAPKTTEDGIKRFRSFKEYFNNLKADLDKSHEKTVKVIHPSTKD